MNAILLGATPLQTLFASLAVFAVGAFASLLLGRHDRAAINVAGFSGAFGALLGLVAGLPSLSGPAHSVDIATPFSFAHFVLRMDPLAALMVCVISLLALVASIYSLAYVREYEGRGVGAMGFFMNLFIASMMLVVTVGQRLLVPHLLRDDVARLLLPGDLRSGR